MTTIDANPAPDPAPAGAPDELDRDAIRKILAGADPALLLNCLVQLTGDVSLLDTFGGEAVQRPDPTRRLMPATVMPDADADAVIDRLSALLGGPDGRADRAPLPVPDLDLFRRMTELAVGDSVGPEFPPLLIEQAGFRLERQVVPVTRRPPASFDVAVIGAGMAGIHTAITAERRGFTCRVFERANDIGGTWRVNTYPGVAVDTPSLYYSFSYELNPDWTHFYPAGGQYQTYLRRVVDRHGLREKISFGTEVTGLRWDESVQRWQLTLRAADGTVSTTSAAAVVTAAGFLNRPSVPNVPGRTDFAGDQFHTAEWDERVPLAGRRVAVIGAGATALQVVPSLIDDVASLALFQRQPHWVLPKFSGEYEVPEAERWALRHVPFYHQWARLKAYWFMSDNLYPNIRADAEWMRDHPHSISPGNERVRQVCLKYIDEMFGDEPDLAAAMTPDFPPMGKRIIKDPGGYYAALRRDHARVVTAAIDRVVPEGIVTADGELIELDVIIWATGFTLDFLSPVEIIGRDGRKLSEEWDGGRAPSSYLGGTVPGFPNLFVTSGPNSSAGHGGGHNFMVESVVHYIMECLQLTVERGARSIEVTRRAHEEHNAEVDTVMAGTIWCNAPTAHTYYRDANGRPILPSPWRMVDFWAKLRAPVEDHFVLS
ncbi:cyclohexanone monooxygenase [Streptomyces pilosus]|uniref:flavin-containing monooxygenase n=1 Tax=Streptomyces pilosus TaxID=28893 RepID=UPI0016790B96|nr:NAD(P)/FAD-dependent oxidoreductase [Streptomyces pilosus]GGV45862.1 cyclohexanone monooxygenase [Streptomyces pilosus]